MMSHLKLADLTSGVGALVLGIGLGALFAPAIDAVAIPLAAIGGVMHAWGMWEKHQFERALPMPTWARTLYWICWLTLAVLALILAIRLLP